MYSTHFVILGLFIFGIVEIFNSSLGEKIASKFLDFFKLWFPTLRAAVRLWSSKV